MSERSEQHHGAQLRIIACAALIRELRSVLDAGGLGDHVDVRYLPANLHNHPGRIVPAVAAALDEAAAGANGEDVPPTLVAYADCGTGGMLDAMLAQRPGVRRLPGAHCYEVFAGSASFAEIAEREPGTFFLTDYLARHFDALVWEGLGLGRHPELLPMYFGNYTKVILLGQSGDPAVLTAAQRAAHMLGLEFEHRHVGRAGLAEAVGISLRRRAA